MTSPNRQDNLIAAATRACQKPVLVALAAQAQSPKKAAELAERNAERLGLSKQDIQDTRWLAILKRDSEALLGPGVDFLAALQQVSQPATQQRSTGMKVVWTPEHYRDDLIKWIRRIFEPHLPGPHLPGRANYQILVGCHSAMSLLNISTWYLGNYNDLLLLPQVEMKRSTLVDENGRLQPVIIRITKANALPMAKFLAQRWQRRIPKALRTKESVVIERAY